jgi:hypothetical protein
VVHRPPDIKIITVAISVIFGCIYDAKPPGCGCTIIITPPPEKVFRVISRTNLHEKTKASWLILVRKSAAGSGKIYWPVGSGSCGITLPSFDLFLLRYLPSVGRYNEK